MSRRKEALIHISKEDLARVAKPSPREENLRKLCSLFAKDTTEMKIETIAEKARIVKEAASPIHGNTPDNSELATWVTDLAGLLETLSVEHHLDPKMRERESIVSFLRLYGRKFIDHGRRLGDMTVVTEGEHYCSAADAIENGDHEDA